jgi:hypothetical protein
VAHSRIDDLRRRVEADPASIAFAQLAEEYRRAGQTEEAVRISREGLTRHPGYLSARVTLGRALLDLGQLDEARTELQFVASEAPENLAAVRGLAEICHREGDAASALEYFQRALSLARHDPELEEIVQQLSRQVGAESGPSSGLTFEEAHQELLSAADRVPLAAAASGPVEPGAPAGDDAQGSTAPFDFDTLVAALGTPAAPPLVEAVVRGEAPHVFELPELPALTGDPFAVLEAELRAQPEGEPEAGAAPTDAATPSPHDESLDEGWLTPRAPELTAEPEPVAAGIDAAPDVPEPRLPSLEAWLPSGDASSPETAEVVDDCEGVDDREGIAAVDGPIGAADEVLAEVADTAATVVIDVAVPAGGADAPASEADLAHVDPPVPADPVEAGPTADPEPASKNAEQPSPPPLDGTAPVRRGGDDVLGDIEDWLHTLQDRSDT